MTNSELCPRSGRILATVVRDYIHTGEPVASVVIARRGALGVSSATIRSVLARLEEQGFVRQPHTSAGRVPTDRGYRFYVDLLLEHRRPGEHPGLSWQHPPGGRSTEHSTKSCWPACRACCRRNRTTSASRSRPVTERSAPAARSSSSRSAARRVLVVAITEDDQITQKVVDGGESLTSDDLRRAAEYVNREFAGLPIDEVREAIVARLQEARGLYDQLMAQRLPDGRTRPVDAHRPAGAPRGRHRVAARRSPQQHGELSLDTLRALVEMIEEKQRLVRLLTEYLDAPGLAVVIGAEHALPTSSRSASSRPRTSTAAAAAASASSARRACATRAPSASSRAPRAPSATRSATIEPPHARP